MLTIAVCDDNPQFAHQLTARLRELCAHLLPERVECRITAAFSSGEEVLRYLRQSSIHILFLDIDMLGMGGLRSGRPSEGYRPRYPRHLRLGLRRFRVQLL